MQYPDAPIQGYTQAYWRTLQALGIANSSAHDIGVDFRSFSNDHFAVMLTTEKVDGVVSSGQNLQGGQECRFSVKNCATASSKTRRCYFALEYDCIFGAQGRVSDFAELMLNGTSDFDNTRAVLSGLGQICM